MRWRTRRPSSRCCAPAPRNRPWPPSDLRCRPAESRGWPRSPISTPWVFRPGYRCGPGGRCCRSAMARGSRTPRRKPRRRWRPASCIWPRTPTPHGSGTAAWPGSRRPSPMRGSFPRRIFPTASSATSRPTSSANGPPARIWARAAGCGSRRARCTSIAVRCSSIPAPTGWPRATRGPRRACMPFTS